MTSNVFLYREANRTVVSVFDPINKTFKKKYFTDTQETLKYLKKVTRSRNNNNEYIFPSKNDLLSESAPLIV